MATFKVGDIVNIEGELHWILDIYDRVFHAVSSTGEVMQFDAAAVNSVKAHVPIVKFTQAYQEAFSSLK